MSRGLSAPLLLLSASLAIAANRSVDAEAERSLKEYLKLVTIDVGFAIIKSARPYEEAASFAKFAAPQLGGRESAFAYGASLAAPGRGVLRSCAAATRWAVGFGHSSNEKSGDIARSLVTPEWERAAREGDPAALATMLAVINGHESVARALAAAGADLSLTGSGAPGFTGKTAAHLAMDRGLASLAAELSTK